MNQEVTCNTASLLPLLRNDHIKLRKGIQDLAHWLRAHLPANDTSHIDG